MRFGRTSAPRTPLAVNHPETYVIGDAHVNTCENRHGFVGQ